MLKSFFYTMEGLFSTMRTVCLAAILFLSYGCGPLYTHPGKTSEQFAADDNACKAAALEVCPPKMEWNSGEESLDFRMRSSREREYHWWDANLNQRSIVHAECLETKGWKRR